MRIVMDAMGSDQHPEPELWAAVEAAKQYGDEIILVGPEDQLKSRLQELGGAGLPIRIIHTTAVADASDKPSVVGRRKDTTLAVGLEALKAGQADAFVSAGSTGNLMATGLFTLGRIRGVKRPAITGLFPVRGGRCVVLDIGANADCRPEFLLQFAIMGSVYAQKMLDIASPRVGLLSNGEEAGKGNELTKATYPLLEASGLNFVGNVEGKEIFGGKVDVTVADGFSGNVLLKTSEAVAKMLTDTIREEIMGSLRTKIGGLLIKPAFGKVRRLLDPSEAGAAPLLGLNGLVFKAHGRSDARAMLNALRAARLAVEANLLEALRSAIQERLEQIKSIGEIE